MRNKTKTRLLISVIFLSFALTSSTMADKAYFNNGDGTVTDISTGLTWMQIVDPPTMQNTWEAALAYCENLEGLRGKSDWRLPSANELFSLVDFSKFPYLIDTNYFPNGGAQQWSSTTFVSNETYYAWVLGYRSMTVKDKREEAFARCVRGGQ